MGVLAVYGVKDAAAHIYYGLHNLQHRGQEGGGIATFDEDVAVCKYDIVFSHSQCVSYSTDADDGRASTRRCYGSPPP